ncbi:MAG: hypothetical protein O2869_03265 [Bacteroidetes bacterium]|jgi:hypothetical protein|nr:hypothetical protein [Bacteroidota bacterium]MDA0950629.1 hypothetical protein [Bacteroidota bacterium]
MVWNTSHSDLKIERQISALVGESFSLLKRFEMRGIGSPKLEILQASTELHTILAVNQDRLRCSIELRPKGVIIHFKSRLDTYALPIPYHKLSIYKGESNSYSLFMDHYKLKIKADDPKVKAFIHKVLNAKVLALEN